MQLLLSSCVPRDLSAFFDEHGLCVCSFASSLYLSTLQESGQFFASFSAFMLNHFIESIFYYHFY